jgi:hypothetical protein
MKQSEVDLSNLFWYVITGTLGVFPLGAGLLNKQLTFRFSQRESGERTPARLNAAEGNV